MAPTSTGSPAARLRAPWWPGYLPPVPVAGLPVRLHAWVLPFHAAVAWLVVDGGWGAVATRLAVVGALLLTVLVHELGHGFVARARGLAVRDIRLHALGGVARIERRLPPEGRAADEWVPALGGPGANLVLGAAACGALAATGHDLVASVLSRRWAEEPAVAFAVANLALGSINLVPAFPADGGRVLRALLARPLGLRRATAVALGVGAGLAFVGAAWAMGEFGPTAVLVVAPVLALLGVHGTEEWRLAHAHRASRPEPAVGS